MCRLVPKFIKENCPECNPRNFERTLAEFTGKKEVVTTILEDSSKEFENEYLYKCCTCGAKMWVGEQWVNENAVKEEESKK